MRGDDKERLCNRLMGAVFCVFVGNDYPDRDCFNKCVQECLNTEILAARGLTSWSGWRNVATVFSKYITVGALRKSSDGSRVYGCPKAAKPMPALAPFCPVDKIPRNSIAPKRILKLRAIEHARTAVIYDKELPKRQAFLWVKRASGSAPEEKDGDKKKVVNKKKAAGDVESSADPCINMADNEDSGVDIGSGITDIGSGRANNDSSS